jgi:hypothetical protein
MFLNWYVDPEKAGEKKDLVLDLAQILAGTALLSGLYFTWGTLQVNREGQITERFTRAIDQLGKVQRDSKQLTVARQFWPFNGVQPQVHPSSTSGR